MLIDFHTHTTASDGALAPAELALRAAQCGVRMLAITDHDTVSGYLALAAGGGAPADVQLIPGIEFSCRWSGVTIHVVGLGVDCAHPTLVRALAAMDQARQERAAKIADKLAARGFAGALAGARQEAGDSQLGRPHFAAWMVACGHVRDHNEAFDRHLGQGKVGDVKAFWPELAQVVSWVTQAGGAAVLAHPYKYKFTGMKLRRLIIDFVAAGGGAIEIQSGRQSQQQIDQLVRYAREFELEVSVGSDFHRDRDYSAPLGVEVPILHDVRGVWERWVS